MNKIVILPLKKADWKGRKLTFSYRTQGYYTFEVHGFAFSLCHHPLKEAREMTFEGELFEDFLEMPEAYGAYLDGTLAGVIGFSMESWNNRLRISELLVFEGFRGMGVGSALMRAALRRGEAQGARMAVLETQTCNAPAIAFYRKMGFAPIGFDLYSYSNADPARQEVRLELGVKLPRS